MQSCSIVAGAQLESAVFGGEFWFAEEHQGFERAELDSVLCLRICRERERESRGLREREREKEVERGRKYGDGNDDNVVVITGFLFSRPWFPTPRAH